jgi:hypothetical protein
VVEVEVVVEACDWLGRRVGGLLGWAECVSLDCLHIRLQAQCFTFHDCLF